MSEKYPENRDIRLPKSYTDKNAKSKNNNNAVFSFDEDNGSYSAWGSNNKSNDLPINREVFLPEINTDEEPEIRLPNRQNQTRNTNTPYRAQSQRQQQNVYRRDENSSFVPEPTTANNVNSANNAKKVAAATGAAAAGFVAATQMQKNAQQNKKEAEFEYMDIELGAKQGANAQGYQSSNSSVDEYDDYYNGEQNVNESQSQSMEEKQPKSKKAKKQRKKKHWLLKRVITMLVCFMVLGGGALFVYLNIETKNDFLWLDLEQLPYKDATIIYAQSQDGQWEEYARLNATQQKQWVDLEDIPLNLQHAFVAIEDQDFYKHNGISITRTIYAVLNEVKYMITGTYFGGEDGIKQGASTITQQLIKNLTYDDDVGGIEGYLRKVREIYRAYKLDAKYEKDEILQAYLNVISFTGNTAGVQAESIKLFNKPVSELTLEQCASIAAITKNPYKYDPVKNPDTHITRRNYILYEMWQQKYITEDEYNSASAQPIGLEAGALDVAKTPITSYFTDKLIEDVSNDLIDEYGLTRSETTNLLYNGGLRIYATVDANLQSIMEENMLYGSQYFPQINLTTQVQATDESGNLLYDANGNAIMTNAIETPQAAMVSIDYDGGLKAVVGGIGEKEISRGFNRGTSAVRQVGSTMKPIGAYVLGIEKDRVHWSSSFMDSPVRKIEDEATGEKRDWPANFSKTYTNENMLVYDALSQSINTVAVRVGERAGISSIYNFVRRDLGITTFTSSDRAAGPMVLGSSTYGVTPYELAGSYMMFGNGGAHTTLHSYTDIQKGHGESILKPTIETKQVISSDTAYVMNRLLRGVMEGAGTASGYSVSGGMDSIGKTGTSSDNRDFWFVGLTPYYVTTVWYGYDSGAEVNTTQGTHAPTTAWRNVMKQAQRNLEYAEFLTDSTVQIISYCTKSGGIAGANCPSKTGYYRQSNIPSKCLVHGG